MYSSSRTSSASRSPQVLSATGGVGGVGCLRAQSESPPASSRVRSSTRMPSSKGALGSTTRPSQTLTARSARERGDNEARPLAITLDSALPHRSSSFSTRSLRSSLPSISGKDATPTGAAPRMSSEASNRGGALAVLSGRVFAGLDNLGNTCFMNAALQCLMSSAPLCIYFMLGKHSPHICESSPTKGRMALAFADLLAKARPESVRARGSVSPQTIRQLVGRYASHFSEYMQHDCQEFLRYFLDSLSEDLYTKDRARPDTLSDAIYNRLNALDQSRYMWNLHLHRQSSVVVDYFGGQLESKIVCSVCGGTSRTFDPVLDISLPLPSSSDSSSQTVGEVHLQDCLEEYTREEMLDGVQCDRCGKRTPCAKSLRVMRRPHVLILHLKRFRYTEYSREKLNTAVAYPLQGLDLRPYMSTESSHTADATYDLYSVVHHVGSLSGGHYTATCLSHSDGHWYDMNDEEVVRLDSPRDKNIGGPSVSTYVLLYKLNSRKRAGSANSTSNSALMHTR